MPLLAPRKIAMVGTAGSRLNAPFTDESYEIWGVGGRGEEPRATRWYELHSLKAEPKEWVDAWCKQLREVVTRDCDLYMIYPRADCGPRVKAYPTERILARFGSFHLTSSFGWMMAHAIDEMVQFGSAAPPGSLIEIWGVDMEYGTEYCIAPETRVLTDKLVWVPAGAVSVGDALIGFHEFSNKDKFRAWRKATVESANVLRRPCYKLYMDDGTELVSSAEHRWLTWSEHEFKWRRTDEMMTRHHRSDRPTKICRPIKPWDKIIDSRDGGYLAAALDGEGHLSQGQSGHRRGDIRIGFSQKENAMSRIVEHILDSYGCTYGIAKDRKGCMKYTLNGKREEKIEFLGKVYPHRLMDKFDADKLGTVQNMKSAVAVVDVEPLGEMEVIGLGTSTGTFIAEGYASHNCQQRQGFRAFISIAHALGITVLRPAESGLSYDPVPYPMWQDDPMLCKVNLIIKRINKQMAAKDDDVRKIRTAIAQNRAVLETLEGLQGVDLGDRIVKLQKETDAMVQSSANISHDIALLEGQSEAYHHWRDYIQP